MSKQYITYKTSDKLSDLNMLDALLSVNDFECESTTTTHTIRLLISPEITQEWVKNIKDPKAWWIKQSND